MGKKSVQKALVAHNLSKRFGDIIAVDGVSFEASGGRILGFLGPNGAGKTTTIKMLSGLMRPDSGTVTVAGISGICPQEITVWDGLTCLEQLRFAGEIQGMKNGPAKERSLELLKALGLSEKKDRLAATLSGGMQRRLNIALALVHSPDVVFLDEPQAGLDPQSRLLVREYIRKTGEAAAVILTTHDMEEAEKLSDDVRIIDHGRIIASGTVKQLKEATGHGDMIQVELGRAGVKKALPKLSRFRDKGLKVVDGDCVAFSSGDEKTLLGLLAVLKRGGIEPLGVAMRKKSLEDVFVSLTGRGLRE